jgi:phosphoglycolate phosphatase-like HAD superfamily hydrolase
VFLEEELERKADQMQVCPGVQQALRETAKLGHNALLTGNWQEGAVRKLQAAGLGDFFSWGAFGDDGPDRDALVPVLRARAASLGLSFDKVVVIGDTPADVDCARAGGAQVVAVQTGWCSHEELLRAEPDLLIHDLVSGLVPLLEFLSA